jgi:dTDP-4-dehydrorhamnose reductase
MHDAEARPPKAKNPNAPEAVKRRKRIQRVYTSVICIATTCSVAYTLEMSAQADKNAAARERAAKLEAYLKVVQKHAADTHQNFVKLTAQYNKVVSDAQRTQRRMLADLRKARSDARHATTASAAPVVYSTSVTFSGGGGSAATAAAASAPTTGTS